MTDNFDLKKYLAENKLMQEASSKINMNDVYFILKTYKFNPRIIDGNRITGIKTIDFGTYDEKTGEDAGMLRIDSEGAIYGQDNWGMDIENENEILDAIDQYRKNQKDLENPLNEAEGKDLYYTAGEMISQVGLFTQEKAAKLEADDSGNLYRFFNTPEEKTELIKISEEYKNYLAKVKATMEALINDPMYRVAVGDVGGKYRDRGPGETLEKAYMRSKNI
jgi:hypothetical protein